MVKSALIKGGGYAGAAGAQALGMGAAAGTMSAVGQNLGARISRLIGSGDYTFNTGVAVNSLIKGAGANANSSFGSTGMMPTRIRHREYVGDVATGSVAGAFSLTSFAINPGLSDSFPYLSNIAQNYDQYVFHGLVYEFVSSTSGTNTGAMGTVIMGGDYNPSTSAYTNKHNMENSGFAVSARLDSNIMYGVECAKGQNTQDGFYVRNGSSALGLEATDLGTFQIATSPSVAMGANTVIGELWVTYDVELKKPSLSQNRSGYAHFIRTGYTAGAAPLGSVVTKDVRYGTCSNVSVDGTTVTFDRVNTGDIYKVTFLWSNVTGAVLSYPVVTTSGLSAAMSVYGAGANLLLPAGGATSSTCLMEAYYTVTSLDPLDSSITLGVAGSLPTGASASVDIFVVNVGSGYSNTQL